MTQITMQIINPRQQIAQSIESASREQISELPSLAKGSPKNKIAGILETKPQINADERRFIVRIFE